MFGSRKQKMLLKLLAMSIKLVRNLPLLSGIAFGDSYSLVFSEIIAMFQSFQNQLCSLIATLKNEYYSKDPIRLLDPGTSPKTY